MTNKLKIGDVFYQKVYQKLRVLVVDSTYFLFEANDVTGWNKSNKLNSHLSFYGSGVKAFFAHHPTYLGNEPFTQHEIDIIRPDLPLSIGRTKKCDWKDVPLLKQNEFEDIFGPDLNEAFNCPKLFLYPKGPKGGRLKEVAITADNNHSFNLKELITKAACVQMEHYQSISRGLGLFRIGIRSKCPTFCIDDYYFGDAEIYLKEEEGFDWEAYFTSVKERKPFFTYEKLDTHGRYQLNFDSKQVAIGRDVFAVKSALSNKIVIQFQIENEIGQLDLSGLPVAIYYFGFIDEQNIFQTHFSISHVY